MKRLIVLAVAATVLAQPAFAFDPKKPVTSTITVLQPIAWDATPEEMNVAHSVRARLLRELRHLGFDAIDSPMTFDDVQRTGAQATGLYVEIAPAEVRGHGAGGVEVRSRNVGVDIGMIVSRVAADLYVYDGRTFALVSQRHLMHEDVAVAPTGIGVGSYRMSLFFALPFLQYARFRAAAGAVVHDAAEEIKFITSR